MTSPADPGHPVPCLVCDKVTLDSVSIHAGLARRHGSIREQISNIVGSRHIDEACETSEIVCLRCLKLVLGISNLELELQNLKQEFCTVFQLGVESRKPQAGKNNLYLKAKNDEQTTCDNEELIIRNDNILFINYNENSSDNRTNHENYNDDVDADVVNDDKNESGSKTGKDKATDVNKRVSDYRTDKNEISNTNVVQDTKDNFSNSVSKENDAEEEALEESDCGAPRQVTSGMRLDDTTKAYESSWLISSSSINEKKSVTSKRSLSKRYSGTLSDAENNIKHFEKVDITSLCTTQLDRTDVASGISDAEIETHVDGVASEECPKEVTSTDIKRSRRKPTVSKVVQPVKRRKTTRKCRKSAKLKNDNETDYNADDLPSGEENIQEDFRQDGNKSNFCKICGDKFPSLDKLADHRGKVHGDLYKYVCDKCPNVRYCNKWELTRHCKLRHQVHIHQCPGCDIEEASQQSLDKHIINKHPESRFFECKICSKAFRTYRYLHFVHIKRCHIGLPIKYYCDKCNKGFKDKSSLDNHKHTHSEVKNYSCEFCGALFRSPYSLKVHVNTHTREKKYTCQICGMSFLRLCNLIGHRKYVHSRDNRYVCEVCGKVVHTHKGLVRHQILYHAKGKLFPCDDCDKCFVKKESLKVHLLTQHSQERPHKCNCGKAYANSSCLRRHLKAAHRVDSGLGYGVGGGLVEENSKAASEDNEEDNVVVITVKESAPHMYSVQAASPHRHEVMVTSDPPSTHVVNDDMVGTEAIVSAQRVELPLLHSTFSTITADRIGLSTPILFAALNPNPVAGIHQTKGTVPDGMSHTSFEPVITQVCSGLQTTNPFHSAASSIVSSDDQQSLEILHEETTSDSQNDSPLTSELLELPAMHPDTASAVPVTYITAWPT